jgi:hypothetical protein
MKQFVVDELRAHDYKKLKELLDKNYDASPLDGIYWFPIAPEVLSDIQIKHKTCQPFYFAVDLEPDRVFFELLVRTKNSLKCSCMGYATEIQCTWLVRQMDKIFAQLGIRI